MKFIFQVNQFLVGIEYERRNPKNQFSSLFQIMFLNFFCSLAGKVLEWYVFGMINKQGEKKKEIEKVYNVQKR